MNKERILVVGQGITGSVLVLRLLKLGHDVWVVDENRELTSSKVAAGLFNPMLVGRRKAAWLSNELFSMFPDFYKDAEVLLNAHFFEPMPMLHLCRDIEEQNEWDVLMSNPVIEKWVNYYEGAIPNYINSDCGVIKINGTGWLNVPLFLDSFKSWIKSKDRYFIANPEIGIDIKEKNGFYSYNQKEFDKVFLCRGEFERDSLPFNYLPFKPAKGQIIDIETDFDLEENIFHKQVFLLPTGKRKARVGSTYTWDELDYEPSETEEQFLLTRLNDYLKGNYKITTQKAGVRPATNSRRPLLGEHPVHNNVFIFNGLGSKAVSMAPYFSQMLLDSIYHNLPLVHEVDISRLKNKPQLF